MFKKILRWLDANLEVALCVILMSSATLLIFFQVIMRYVFHNSLSWSEELARYMFVWLIYLGISYGCKLRKHIKIDAALSLFPKKVRPYITIIGDILFAVFAVYIIRTGYLYASQQAGFGKSSAALELPMQYVYISTVIGFGLALIRQIQTIIFRIKCIKNGEEAD